MATIEKLMKSWEALKHLPTQITDEISSRRKEKISLCVTTADTFCYTPGLKTGGVNVMLLNFAMESLLQMCNDADSDVRMTADESLNRIITQAVMDSNVMKVQVELHKEIKRNGNARSLRAALWRFAYLSHMIRPQKGKPYVNNLVPCLIQISKRAEETVQETLSTAIPQIFKALGLFTTDKDVKELLKAFLQNLSADSAQVRRTSASCIVSICRNCRKPKAFLMETLNTLVDTVIPINENQAVPEILGILGCLRAVLPQFSMNDVEQVGQGELQGSFGVQRGHNRAAHCTDCMVQVYELSIHFSKHADHNVVNAALELLHQLLLSPPAGLVPVLLSPHGISGSKILASSNESSPFQHRSLSQMSVAGSIPPCDESSLLELDSDLPTAMSAAVSAPLLERWVQDGMATPLESIKSKDTVPPKMSVARLQLLDAADPCEPDLALLPENDNIGAPAADVLSTDSSPDDVQENYLLEHLEQEAELVQLNTPPPSASGVSLASSPGTNQAEAKYQVCDIGSLTDGSIPLVYCARHLATSFLLTGHPGYRMPDRNIRVSVKALALNCVAAIVRLHPNAFQLYLDKDPISPSRRSLSSATSSQPLCELLLFAKHTDPQLRAICCTLLAGLVRSVLVQSGGNWQSWQRKADAKVSACLALPRLLQFLIQGLEDESSTTCRQTLVALTQCLPEVLKSRDCHEVQPVLLALSNLAQNPYWLVKVKLLELVSELSYAVIHYVTGSSTFQEKVIYEVLFDLLRDEDSRVRKAASEAIVRIIPNLHYPVDRQNVSEVITVACDMSDSQLSRLLEESEPFTSMPGKVYQKIPRLDNLSPPFDTWNNIGKNSQQYYSIESSLSRIVNYLSQLLLESSFKHLTLGCCETLSLLAEKYPPALYVNGWGCLFSNVPPQPANTKREAKHIVSDGSSLSNFSAGSGLLHTSLSLLLTSPTTLELGAQQWLNSLAGNLFCGVAVANMYPVESPPPGTKLEPNPYPNQLWSMFKDKQISIAVESLLLHLMRTLNIISHILEDSNPISSGSKPGLPSLSPIKRHGSTVGRTAQISSDLPADSKGSRGLSPIKNIIHGDKEDKSDEKKSGKSTLFGSFTNSQHYLKYYELLRSAYTNYKTSLEAEICEKFVGLISSTLKVLSQLLEVMTVVEAGRIAEELLFYLRGTMSLSPTATVNCVSQLLKCVVGMNLVSFWNDRTPDNGSKQTLSSTISSIKDNGFYYNCFQGPYLQLVQFLAAASAAKPHSVEVLHDAGLISNLRLRGEVGGRTADTTFLASYIRLFEPMVIESLQQYTVTSDIQLQVKVLSLLTQLVQLRVNYCLLDSEMVFIGFVQKQFEFIEEGQILNAEELIMSIFHFMVLLSFEKHHSKSITTIPKVIQLCDGLMASGQNPLTHCIPALLPVVEHGFLSKSNIDTEELETQREVMVAMLLRLVEYHQVMKLLSIVLVECRSWPDGEERWRRWSRQVCDAVLGHLTSGRLRLDSREAQKALHQLLLHSLASSVFRPVDPLLRVLFSPPPHVESSLQSITRWLGTVLAVMLVLVAQGKEETTLGRLEELEIALPALFFRGGAVHLSSPDPLNVAAIATSPLSTSTPQLTFARLVLRVIGLVAERIDSIVLDPASSSDLLKECHYLEELLAHFLLICIHMFQSGSHCKIGSAAVELVAGHATEDSLLLEDANAVFLELAPACPLLMFLWCYLLTLLNYGNHAFWARVLPVSSKDSSKKDETSQRHQSLNMELVRTGATIVYCDFMSENSGESEQLIWLLNTQMLHIVELSSEAPVQELIVALHRSPDHSISMLQAIQKNNIPLNKATTVIRLLKCLEGIHPACSGALLLLLADHLVGHSHPALARRAAQLCTRQAEYLLTLSPPQVAEQLSREQLRDVLYSLHHSQLDRKHSGLISILNKLGSQCLALSPLETDQARPLSPISIQNLKLDKEWYLSQVKLRCSQTSCIGIAVEESTQLLGHLDLEDAVSVLSSPDTHLSILQLCFRHGTHQTLQAHTNTTQRKNIEDNLSPLYRAARMVLMQRVHHFTELVPEDHQVFLPIGRLMTDAEQVYSRNLCQILSSDVQLDSLFCIAAAVSSYIYSLEKLCGVVPSESAENLVAFALLCLEAVHSLLLQDDGKSGTNAEKVKAERRLKSLSVEAHDVPSSSSGKVVSVDKKFSTPQPYCFELGLECASRVLCDPSLGVFLEQSNHLTWLASSCSAVTAIVHFFTLGEPLPSVSLNGLSEALSKSESLTIAHACHQMSTLVAWLERHRFNRICQNIPQFLLAPIRKLIVRLSRTPLLNSYVWTPPDVWKHGWAVALGGTYHVQVPPLPTEFLQDMDVLRQFIFRVTLLGWTSRQQFEETWMSLLSVLSSESNNEDMPSEEVAIETEANSAVIEAISSLLLHTLLLPVPGNPNIGQFMHCAKDFPLNFSRESTLGKLHAIQQRLAWKEEGLHGKKVYSVFDRPNLEHIHSTKRFCYGQVSVEYLQYALSCSQGATEQELFSESVIFKYEERCKALEASGMDVNSCLYFLLDLCSQWTQPQLSGISGVQSRPLHEALCAVLSVSDLFTEQSQWQWLLQTSLDLGRNQPVEDDILQQYIVLSQCKACAVLQPDAAIYERIHRTVDGALRSSFVPTVTAALHGLSYLLQGGLLIQCGRETVKTDSSVQPEVTIVQDCNTTLPEVIRHVVTLTAEYICKKLVSNLTSSVNEESNIILWSLAFYLLDNFSRWKVDALEQAVPVILQQAITLAHPNSRNSLTLQGVIMQGLERLVVSQSEALVSHSQKQITKLAIESIADPNPGVLFHSLQLLLSCMYMGHENQIMMQNYIYGNKETDNAVSITDPELLVEAMEKTSALFDRVKKGYPQEVELVCSVLPNLLTDFFPASDVLTKVIGEFLSQQQPHPRLLAGVVFQVFECAVAQSQLSLLQEWFVLSLSNFTQTLPVPMATWCLTCFFISASCNPWLRALFPHVQSRIGRCEFEDRKLLCLSATDFYRQLTSESQTSKFVSTFQAAVKKQPNSPYAELLASLS